MSEEIQHDCPRCGYTTEKISHFKNHLERKNICKPKIADISLDEIRLKYIVAKVVTHTCENCEKSFFSQSSYYVHKKLCKNSEVIEELKKEILVLKTTVMPSTNITNNITNNIINIQINGLGKEDMSFLTDNKNYSGFMSSCLEQKIEGLCNFLVQKHFNKPENQNIKKLNKKDKFITIYDGKKWKPRFIEDVLDDVFNNMERDFQQFLNKGYDKDRLRKNIMDRFMKSVGEPLNWNLDHAGYQYDEENESKEAMKKNIYILACEYIYQKSKEVPSEASSSRSQI
jgi:hypothetical protein